MKCFLALILLLGLAVSCDSVNLKQSDYDSEILVDNNLFTNAPNDSFDFINVEIIQNCLKFTIDYGGGCGDIELKLISSEMVMESNPPQINVRLSLKDEDNCKANIRKEISFDLTPINKLVNDQVILNIKNWDQSILYSF